MLTSLLKKHWWLVIVAVIELGVLGFLVYEAVTIQKQQQQLADTQEQLDKALSSVSATQKQIITGQQQLTSTQAKLQSDVGTLADKVETSRESLQSFRRQTTTQLSQVERQAAQEAEQEIAEVKTSLQNEISQKIEASTQRTSAIVSDWGARIALIRCGDKDEEMNRMNLGSATLFEIDDQVVFLTNRHVLMDDDMKEERCFINFPDSDEDPVEFSQENIHAADRDLDYGYLLVESPTPFMQKQLEKDLGWCKEQPEVGSSMVVIGYPSIGADNSITATEGIISGYDGKFYVTSAKVDKGNSGGVAVWTERNCYLGIPTKTYKGIAEALARILDVREIGL